MQVFHVISFEWNGSVQHGKQNDTCAPQISFKTFVALIFNDLRSDVGRCTTLLVHYFSSLYLLTDSKVSYFDIAFPVKQDVIKFDVSM